MWVEKSKFAHIQSSAESWCQILTDNFLRRGTQFAVSTICQCCMHTKQCAICAALPLTWSQTVSSSSSQQYLHAATCTGRVWESTSMHFIHISFFFFLITLPVSRQQRLAAAAVAVWRFHFLLSFSNCAYHKQAPSTKRNDRSD